MCKQLMSIRLLSDSSIEKQVALLQALYGKHFYKSLFYSCESTCMKMENVFCGLKYRFLVDY